MKKRLLIVDDSPDIVDMIREHLADSEYDISTASSGSEARTQLGGGFQGVVLLDFMLPDVDGLALLDEVRTIAPLSKVIMITAHGSIGMAMEATKNRNAFYVHSKGEDAFLDRLAATVANAFRNLELESRLERLESQVRTYSFDSIITQSRRLQAIFRTLENVVDSKVAVLVLGESGTGKELVAKAIHYNGPRSTQPFVAINCAGIPDTLLESELFGYEKGAFTGAYTRKSGKFEQANKGTLFLDEIGEMNLALQAKILRVLQEKSFERLGGHETVNVNVRIISATNKDLEAEVREGRFREDLYYRLSVFPVHLPPLRERKEDIPILAEHFLKRFNDEEDRKIEGFTRRAMDQLLAFNYPGNVRQLENVVSHAVVVASGSLIDIPDLPPYLQGREFQGFAQARSQADDFVSDLTARILPLEKLEELAIRKAVAACNGNVSLAARLLGVSRATIYRKTRDEPEQEVTS